MELSTYTGESLSNALSSLGCTTTYINKIITPSLVRYNFELKDLRNMGKINKIAKYLGARLHKNVRVTESNIGDFCLELERDQRSFCTFAQLNKFLANKKDGEFILGVDENNQCLTYNIEDCPHLLVSGCTSSGKSVFLNSFITSITCYSSNTGILLIDPKQVEFSQFENAPNLICPIITDTAEAVAKLNQLCDLMDNRYSLLRDKGLQNNSQGTFKKIVIVVDELADLMLTSGKDVETPLVRLAQKGRAAGIHLVLATQRPTVNVVTGLIKANIPTRIAFAMSSVRDSVVMLDHSGANELLGKGDCLVKLPDKLDTIRVQAPFISNEDIKKIFGNIKNDSITGDLRHENKKDKEYTETTRFVECTPIETIISSIIDEDYGSEYSVQVQNMYDCLDL